jgi:monofunctional biosynthetic peptidoglycan transglycosylase
LLPGLRGVVIVLAVLVLLPYGLAPLYNFGHPVSTVMLWRWLSGSRVVRNYIPIGRIARPLPLVVIIAEDGRFCGHFGIDFREIQNAIAEADDLDDLRGGSTITQQVAKNLFLWGGRSYVRKALEFPLALWIDLVMPKRRILELYFNIAEWGPNGEFGVDAAAWRAFGKSAANVSPHEAALLAAVLPNPLQRDARSPGPGLRRLAGLYQGRAARAAYADDCLRRTP